MGARIMAVQTSKNVLFRIKWQGNLEQYVFQELCHVKLFC